MDWRLIRRHGRRSNRSKISNSQSASRTVKFHYSEKSCTNDLSFSILSMYLTVGDFVNFVKQMFAVCMFTVSSTGSKKPFSVLSRFSNFHPNRRSNFEDP